MHYIVYIFVWFGLKLKFTNVNITAIFTLNTRKAFFLSETFKLPQHGMRMRARRSGSQNLPVGVASFKSQLKRDCSEINFTRNVSINY